MENEKQIVHQEIEELLHNIKQEQCLSKKILQIETLRNVLERSSTQLDLLFFDHQELFHDIVIVLTNAGMVKNFKNELERDCLRSDFNCVSEATESSIYCLKLLLPCIQQLEWDNKCLKAILVAVIVFCATHSDIFLWSSEKCVNESKGLLHILLRATSYNDIESLFLGNEITGCRKKFSSNLVHPVINFLKPQLTRHTWKINASTRYIFRWFLHFVKHPNLVDYLMDVLPPSLLFVDDHSVENKVLGVDCIHHIIENVPPTELKMNGVADVVYDALKHLTYTSEVSVINVLYPCLLSFLAGQEKDPKSKTSVHKVGRYDDIYRQLLWNMEHEQKIAFRVSYSSHIQKYISAMGITVVRHMKRTLRVLIDYISVYDDAEQKSRINALHAMKELIRVAWPRIPSHWAEIMTCILCCIYDVETREDELPNVKTSVLNAASDCALHLKRACPDHFMELLAEMPTEQNLPALALITSLKNCE